jgi:hypothetical protein
LVGERLGLLSMEVRGFVVVGGVDARSGGLGVGRGILDFSRSVVEVRTEPVRINNGLLLKGEVF